MDQFHFDVLALSGLPESDYRAIRRAINGKSFVADLRRAIREVGKKYPALEKVKLTISS